MGPALLPENLERLRKPDAAEGHPRRPPATQMPAFADVLSAEEIEALADYIYTPVPMPRVGRGGDPRLAHRPPRAGSLPDKPVFAADPLNLFIVVEAATTTSRVLDGDKLEPIHRFPRASPCTAGRSSRPDGRYVFFASRDGWITKFDIWNLKVVAEMRAGINTRNAAVSATASTWRWPTTCRTPGLLDADLNLLKIIRR
jgi:hypothetical protein